MLNKNCGIRRFKHTKAKKLEIHETTWNTELNLSRIPLNAKVIRYFSVLLVLNMSPPLLAYHLHL